MDGNNAIEILMRTKGLSMQEAAYWIEAKFKEILGKYVDAKKRLRSFGPGIDGMVDKYLRGAEQWASANLAWSFDSQRYFGVEHAKVKRTLKVKIKRAADQ